MTSEQLGCEAAEWDRFAAQVRVLIRQTAEERLASAIARAVDADDAYDVQYTGWVS